MELFFLQYGDSVSSDNFVCNQANIDTFLQGIRKVEGVAFSLIF